MPSATAAPRMERAMSRSRKPAGVNRTPSNPRSNSASPVRSSIRATLLRTVLTESFSRVAAPRKLPASASSAKMRKSSQHKPKNGSD